MPDPHFTKLTSSGTWLAGMVRFVAGGQPGKGGVWNFSRSPDSVITLDGISVGLPHWYSGTIPGVLEALAKKHPDLYAYAFGADAPRTKASIQAECPERKGEYTYLDEVYHWIAGGWYEIGRHPDWLASAIEDWIGDYVGGARTLIREFGWPETGVILAAVARMANSRGTGGTRTILKRFRDRLNSNDPMRVLEAAYRAKESDGGYEHYEDRWRDKLMKWPEFSRPVRLDPATELNWSAEVVRHDGTRPRWATGAGGASAMPRLMKRPSSLWRWLAGALGAGAVVGGGYYLYRTWRG